MQASPLPPAEFVAKAQERGFVFAVKPGDQLAVKPPAPGAMTESVRRYVKAKKPELLALLRTIQSAQTLNTGRSTKLSENLSKPDISREMVATGRLPKALQNTDLVVTEQLLKPGENQKNPESAGTFERIRTENQALLNHNQTTSIDFSPLVLWALSEARRGFLPEPAEALTLPSGQRVAEGGLSAWLIAAESRSAGLAHHSATSVDCDTVRGTPSDCALALAVVQRDMVFLALWARHARLSSVRGPRVCCLESSGMQ